MDKETLVIDYLNQELSPQEVRQFEQALATDPELQTLLSEYRVLYGSFDAQEILTPEDSSLSLPTVSEKVESRPARSTKIVSLIKYAVAVAAAALMLVIVRHDLSGDRQGSGIHVSDDITASNHQFASLLTSPSVTTRISAVQQSADINDSDQTVINLLVQTLEKDKSPNVRLATLEALEKYMHVDQVRETMIRRLSEESDDFVMIALIQMLSNYNDSDAIQPIKRLTQQTDTPKYIKDEAYLGLTKIKTI